MPNANLRAALAERNGADRKDVRFQILLALPFTLLGIGFANGLGLLFVASLFAFGIRVGLGTAFVLFNILLAIAIVIDLKKHPNEVWFQPRYYQSDGSVKGHEFGPGGSDHFLIYLFEREKGSLGGMPIMTNISDPHNLGQRGRAITSGFANLILGGPRSISKALALRRRIVDRSKKRTVASAEAFVAWLSANGSTPELDLKEHLAEHPELREGFALARELEVVGRRRNPVEFHYHVR